MDVLHVGLDKYHAPQWLGARASRRFHVMAKPAGSACNLDCTYCFYLSKRKLPGGPGGGHMHDDVLEPFIRHYIRSVTADEVVFSWQGGEPTLLGLEFFRKVVALERKHAGPASASRTTCRPTARCSTRSGRASSRSTTSWSA